MTPVTSRVRSDVFGCVLSWSSQSPLWQVNKYIILFFDEGGGLRRLVVSYDEVRGGISFVVYKRNIYVWLEKYPQWLEKYPQ